MRPGGPAGALENAVNQKKVEIGVEIEVEDESRGRRRKLTVVLMMQAKWPSAPVERLLVGSTDSIFPVASRERDVTKISGEGRGSSKGNSKNTGMADRMAVSRVSRQAAAV